MQKTEKKDKSSICSRAIKIAVETTLLGELELAHLGFLLILSKFQRKEIKWNVIAKAVHLSERVVREYAKKLEDEGFIQREKMRYGVLIHFSIPKPRAAADGRTEGNTYISITSTYSKEIQEIIDDLNKVSGRGDKKKFRVNSETTQKSIAYWLRRGHTVADFKQVHRNRRDWVGDPKMDQYYCPATLYRKNHFEDYLAIRRVIDKSKMTTSKWHTPGAKKRAAAEKERLRKKMERAGLL